jgi:class 3 adenylate cyclase
VSDATRREVEGQFHFSPAPPQVLRGRRESTAVFRLAAPSQD